MPLRFHWRMLLGGEESRPTRSAVNSRIATGLPDLEAQISFCRSAQEAGIDSLLTDFGFSKPDPILLVAALGMATENINFIVAYRSGLLCPTIFVQQLNTLSQHSFCINQRAVFTQYSRRPFAAGTTLLRRLFAAR